MNQRHTERLYPQIKYDPKSLGALVTTHKIDLLTALEIYFEILDPYAELCGDVSSISKQGDKLVGHAKDPSPAARAWMTCLDLGISKKQVGMCFVLGQEGLVSRPHSI